MAFSESVVAVGCYVALAHGQRIERVKAAELRFLLFSPVGLGLIVAITPFVLAYHLSGRRRRRGGRGGGSREWKCFRRCRGHAIADTFEEISHTITAVMNPPRGNQARACIFVLGAATQSRCIDLISDPRQSAVHLEAVARGAGKEEKMKRNARKKRKRMEELAQP